MYLHNPTWLLVLDHVHALQQCVTAVCKLNGIWSKFRGIMSHLHLKFGYLGRLLLCVAFWQCVVTEKTQSCQEGHDTRGYFGVRHCAPLSSVRANKSKMAPYCVVEGQMGRWVPDTLWHVCVKSLIMSAFDSVHFGGEGLTWQVSRDANDNFLRLLFSFWFY